MSSQLLTTVRENIPNFEEIFKWVKLNEGNPANEIELIQRLLCYLKNSYKFGITLSNSIIIL
ncbi:MAG: hypothetical protein EAX91_09925 [Candidatus Lokiarchaeota archaeon]|nr:hypothetical protein [Candidatus Lokiarchaeota archaeon]